MKYFDWNKEKNEKLKKERNISFEEIIIAILEGKVKDITNNPSSNFPNQNVYVVEINEYIYYIPYIEDEEKIFFKTIIPSRKATKKYLAKK